jgi:hypothetical protein
MSGGFVKPQGRGKHQVVIFTFAGELKRKHAKAWNDAITKLKAALDPNVTGVTMSGHASRPRKKGRGRKPR